MIITRGFGNTIVTRGYSIIPFYGDKKEFELFINEIEEFDFEL